MLSHSTLEAKCYTHDTMRQGTKPFQCTAHCPLANNGAPCFTWECRPQPQHFDFLPGKAFDWLTALYNPSHGYIVCISSAISLGTLAPFALAFSLCSRHSSPGYFLNAVSPHDGKTMAKLKYQLAWIYKNKAHSHSLALWFKGWNHLIVLIASLP